MVAGMFLLAKSRKDGLGNLFTRVAWLVIILSGLMLGRQLINGGKRLAYRTGIMHQSDVQHFNMKIKGGNRMMQQHGGGRYMMSCCCYYPMHGDMKDMKCCDDKVMEKYCKEMMDDDEEGEKDDDGKDSITRK